MLVCAGLGNRKWSDGRIPGVWGWEGWWSVRPTDFLQTTSDRDEDYLLGESNDVTVMSQ